MSRLAAPPHFSMSTVVVSAILAIAIPAGVAEASSRQVSDLEQMQAEVGGRDLGSARLWNVPDAIEDAPYTVTIDGASVPLESAGKINPAYYVRFQLNKPLTLQVKVSLKDGDALNLQPLRYRERLEVNDGSFTLDIDSPGPRVVAMESRDGSRHTPLIILAEEPGAWDIPAPAGEFYDVTKLAGNGPQSPITASLQEILDACGAADQGGTVYFGPGVYYTAGLNVRDNTMLYLAPGALLYAVPDPAAFSETRHLLFFDEISNSGLAGYGVIDGNGDIVRGTTTDVSVALVRFRKSQDIYVQNVTLRNAAGWNTHIIGCDRVKIDGVRVLADWGVLNTDGIDPDSSSNVHITNTFVKAGDDAFCVKTTNWRGVRSETRGVEIRDSMVMSLKSPLKLGTESKADIRDVLFENIDVVHSARGIALWKRDGHEYSNIVFRNIRMDVAEFEGEKMSGEPFRISIQDRHGGGNVRNVLFEDIQVTAPYRAVFTGRDGCVLKDVTFRNIDWHITPARIKTDAVPLTAAWVVDRKNELSLEGNPLIVVHRAENFVFENVTIDWSNVQEGPWDRLVDEKRSSRILLNNVEHQQYPFQAE